MSHGAFHWSSPLFNLTYWWLSGGIAPTSCVGAYQAKGAASLAASYVNLANPGSDLTLGVAPTWDSGNGWRGTSSAYLKTGLTPALGWSMFIRFQGSASGGILAGSYLSGNNSSFVIMPSSIGGTAHTYYYAGSTLSPAGAVTLDSVIGMAADNAYLNGASEGSIGTGTVSTWYEIYLMCVNAAGSAAGILTNASYVKAVAIYNTTLTAAQAATVSAAMAAL